MIGGTNRAQKNGWHALSPRRAWLAAPLSLFAILLPVAASAQPVTTPSPFYLGGDISLESFMQQEGIHYRVGGAVAQNVDKIMYDHGANLFRLRVFVNPATAYTTTSPNKPNYSTGNSYPNPNYANYGEIQTTAYDIALAQQIRADAPGAKILLDFHYSDYWADPGKQFKPVEVPNGLQWRS